MSAVRISPHDMFYVTTQQPTPEMHTLETLHAEIDAGKKLNYIFDNSELNVGVVEMHGLRPAQEDRVLVSPLKTIKLSHEAWKLILRNTVLALEEAVEKNKIDHNPLGVGSIGSCLLSNIIIDNTIYTATVGDSRAYVVTVKADGITTETKLLNQVLHNPTVQSERDYITKRGGYVFFNRLNGQLAVSRAIGDTEYGSAINHTPDVYAHTIPVLENEKVFLITACDGLTEKAKTAEKIGAIVADAIRDIKKKNIIPATIAMQLARSAFKDGSGDNISVIVTPINFDNLTIRSVNVFDGHAGSAVAEYLYNNFNRVLQEQINQHLEQKKLRDIDSAAKHIKFAGKRHTLFGHHRHKHVRKEHSVPAVELTRLGR